MDKKILEILEKLNSKIAKIEDTMARKSDLGGFATKSDLNRFATKDDLNRFATKDDLNRFATKDDLTAMRGHFENKFATKEDLENMGTRIIEELSDVINGFGVSIDERKASKEDVSLLDARVTQIEQKIAAK